MKSLNFHSSDNNLPPTILTLFGATGDLSAEYLLPSLFHMADFGMLPKDFKLVCVGRKDLTSRTYLDFICKKSTKFKHLSHTKKRRFLKWLRYFKGDFEDQKSFIGLSKYISDQESSQKHLCYNRLFYFATSPRYFSVIAGILKSAGLLVSCKEHNRQSRVLVEKPFGSDLASAKSLNNLLLKYFLEKQIYRIDHYVGKETVQNLIVARFANTIFEPLWNKEYIDHLEISILYDYGVEGRTGFYDQTGAIKDVVQNHGLQMLALMLMDEPRELTEQDIRSEKYKILSALKKFVPEDFLQNIVLGQYQKYPREVGRKTDTETFVAMKIFVESPRWQGVPIYFRTGKALHRTVTEISVHFKELPRCLFKNCAHNVLTFRIQPDESVNLQINNKIPGFGINLHQSNLEFSYHRNFKHAIPGAYERLLLDFLEGDQRLFIRSDEIEAAWEFVDSVISKKNTLPVYSYKQHSQGPKESEVWMQKQNREWWTK